MKSLANISILLLLIVVMGCQKDSRPNYQFMPNMYEPVGYETYSESKVFNNGIEAQLPVEGTVPRGFIPFGYENTTEGYELAKTELKNPLELTEENLASGKAMYDIYCAICHGSKGDGQGELVKREKILGIPSYADPGRNITQGSIYHTIYYGKNTMGSYANQLTEKERWQVVAYVEHLKANLEK